MARKPCHPFCVYRGRRLRIAITGGVAEGKSTVLGYVREHGLTVVSADDLARDVFNDPYTQDRIGHLLNAVPPVTADDLRQRISASTELRRSVNELMHPLIAARIESSIAFAIEVPLLIEACL